MTQEQEKIKLEYITNWYGKSYCYGWVDILIKNDPER